MKKTLTLLAGLFAGTALFAQITVTYQVDVAAFVAGGNVLSDEGIRVGGNFTDNGSTVVNWTPLDPSCAMSNISGTIWSIAITYPTASAGQTQLLKFVNGDWGSNEGGPDLANCGAEDGFGGFNRTITIPAENTTLCFLWDKCDACGPLSVNEETITSLTVFPNPAKDVVNFTMALNGANEAAVKIFDLSGKVLLESNNLTAEGIAVNISSLAPGTYMYAVIAGEAVKSGTLTKF